MKRLASVFYTAVHLVGSLAMASAADFPAGWVPFTSIYYVTTPNSVGDRLVVGRGLDALEFSAQLGRIALPSAQNEMFSGSGIELAPGRQFGRVYIPTAAERAGDFSPFAGLLIDPTTEFILPSGIIPQVRLYSLYAFRIAADVTADSYPMVLPHLACGPAWKTTILLRNESDRSADVTMLYFADDGTPLAVPIGNAFEARTTLTIPPHGQTAIETSPAKTDLGGWAAATYTNTGVRGQGIFLWRQANGEVSEAVAPAIRQAVDGVGPFTMPFDNTEDAFSGYGFANTGNGATQLRLRAYDDSGRVLGEYVELLSAHGHTALLLPDRLPQTQGRRGLLEINGGVAPLGFKFIRRGTRFTTWLP